MKLQILPLLELHYRANLLVNTCKLASIEVISTDKVFLELFDRWIIEVLIVPRLIEEELIIQEESDELVISAQSLSFVLAALSNTLLHHDAVVLMQYKLDLLEVLPPTVS